MTATRRLRILAVVVAALGIAVATAAPAAGQASPRMSLGVEEPLRPELPYRLAATLRAPDGSPVNGVEIRFGVHTDLFGGRTAHLGTATTDSTGTARLNLVPRSEVFAVEASFAGNDDVPAVSVIEQLTVPPEDVVAGGLVHDTHSLLAPVQDVMPAAITAAVVLLWLLLLALAGQTVMSIRRGAVAADATDLPPDGPDPDEKEVR